jgi:hypothetical protein
MKTLFLQAPSFDGFDGGAGSRYQAKREIKSFWYPTWLAQPAAMVPDSRVLDAPADEISVEDSLKIAEQYDLVIIHTSTPSFPTDAKFAELLKERKPHVMIGLVGAKVAVDPSSSLTAKSSTTPARKWPRAVRSKALPASVTALLMAPCSTIRRAQ